MFKIRAEPNVSLDCRGLSRFENFWFNNLYWHEQVFWKPLQPVNLAVKRMDNELPKIIRIMPDYGHCYASDEYYFAFDVINYFENHSKIKELRNIEDQLYGLACWIDSGEADNNPNFPWDKKKCLRP